MTSVRFRLASKLLLRVSVDSRGSTWQLTNKPDCLAIVRLQVSCSALLSQSFKGH